MSTVFHALGKADALEAVKQAIYDQFSAARFESPVALVECSSFDLLLTDRTHEGPINESRLEQGDRDFRKAVLATGYEVESISNLVLDAGVFASELADSLELDFEFDIATSTRMVCRSRPFASLMYLAAQSHKNWVNCDVLYWFDVLGQDMREGRAA